MAPIKEQERMGCRRGLALCNGSYNSAVNNYYAFIME